MKTASIGILLTLSLVLGAVCFVQMRQLRTAREQVRAAEIARTVEAEAREAQASQIKMLERGNQRLEQQVQQFARVTSTLRSNDVRQSSNLLAYAQQLKSSLRSGGGEAGEENGLFGKGMMGMVDKMMKDPAMRDFMKDQQKTVINQMYAGLFKEMKLTPDEREKLKSILIESQMKNIDLAQGMFGEDKTGVAVAVGQQISDSTKQTEGEIKALLGEDRFGQYENYQKTMGERMQLDQFKNQLSSEAPLSEEQTKQMLELMQSEKAAIPMTMPTPPTSGVATEMFTAEVLEQQMKWAEDYNRRVLEGAGKILTSDQLKQYQAFQEQQASMQKLSLQMVKGMFGGGKAVKTP